MWKKRTKLVRNQALEVKKAHFSAQYSPSLKEDCSKPGLCKMVQGHSEGSDSNTTHDLNSRTQTGRAIVEHRLSKGTEQRLRGLELENKLARITSVGDDLLYSSDGGSSEVGPIPWIESR